MKRPYHNGPRALAPTVDKITRRLFGKRGFTESAVLNDWPSIVGENLAQFCLPEKIIYPGKSKIRGTLRLRVSNGAFAVELQHSEPVVIERINAFFGYQAVSRLHLVQGPLPRLPHSQSPPTKALQRAQSAASPPQCTHDIEHIDDPELKSALEALGRAIDARS